MEQATANHLTSAQLTESERRTVEHFASRLGEELGNDLHALWLYRQEVDRDKIVLAGSALD